MGAIFGFFFFIIILVLVIGLSIVGGILRFIFGFGRKSGSRTNGRFESESSQAEEETPPAKKKIFDKEDGEYVDFEEIKEDK